MKIDPENIIEELIASKFKVRETARKLGISPGTIINWQRKASSIYSRQRLKKRGLKRQSTRPKNYRITSLEAIDQDNITFLRKETGYCAPKIKSILKIDKHHRTIHRFLLKKGLINTPGSHRRPLFQDTKHMHTKNVTTLGKLQMDVKYITPDLSGLNHTCYLYAIMDILSRYKQGLIFSHLDQAYSIQALRLIVPNFPFKSDFIQTDNGFEFQRRFKVFTKEVLGLKHHHIHKSNPNENAVIERSFRTDEEEFFFNRLQKYSRPKNILELNALYRTYLDEYNQKRPHLSLNLLTPMDKVKSVQ